MITKCSKHAKLLCDSALGRFYFMKVICFTMGKTKFADHYFDSPGPP